MAVATDFLSLEDRLVLADWGNRGRTRICTPASKWDYKFGTQVTIERIRNGLTQEALADRVGVEVSTLSRRETGVRPASVDFGVRVAIALGHPLTCDTWFLRFCMIKPEARIHAIDRARQAARISLDHPEIDFRAIALGTELTMKDLSAIVNACKKIEKSEHWLWRSAQKASG